MANGETSTTFSDLKPRLIAAATLAILSGFFLIWGGFAFAGFIAAGMLLMTLEIVHIVRRDWDVPKLGAVLMGASAGVGVLVADMSMAAAFGAALVGVLLASVISRQRPCWTGVAGYFLIILAGLAVVTLRMQPGGLWLVLWVVLCVVAADVGGYAFGRRFQGPKFWPAVSPKKTWSGVLGGLFLTLVVAGIYGVASDGNVVGFLWLGAVISIVSVAGDLLESAAKRHYGVKDAGSILPGHGGLLDRFDGMTAVMIVFLAILQLTDLQAILGVDYSPPFVTSDGL